MRTVTTPRLTLEPQVAAHAEAMFAVLGDPAIYAFENEPPRSLEWLRDRYEKLESRQSPDGREAWLNWVLRLADGQPIGYVQATVHPDHHAAIAYELGSAWWGQGLAQEGIGAMLELLAAECGVQRFTAVAKRANHRSLRLLQRLGFAEASASAHATLDVPADEVLVERAA
jgi:ribosomal-protein-alanine N-acetyltransferase